MKADDVRATSVTILRGVDGGGGRRGVGRRFDGVTEISSEVAAAESTDPAAKTRTIAMKG